MPEGNGGDGDGDSDSDADGGDDNDDNSDDKNKEDDNDQIKQINIQKFNNQKHKSHPRNDPGSGYYKSIAFSAYYDESYHRVFTTGPWKKIET